MNGIPLAVWNKLSDSEKAEMVKAIDSAKAEAAAAAEAKAERSDITLKMSEKGCVSMYGMVSRGIHIYPSHLRRILNNAEKITRFMEANAVELKRRSDAARAANTAED